MGKDVDIIYDTGGKSIVVLHNIRFRGKRQISWNEVKEYLKKYIGKSYMMLNTDKVIWIGTDFPDEFTGSKYTRTLKGTNAKAKANAAQGIPELIQIAVNGKYKENLERKHDMNAKFGWYRYTSHFALPVYDEKGEVERYNIFGAEMLIRHDANGKLYLYDILNIKKETSNPPSLLHTVKTHFLDKS